MVPGNDNFAFGNHAEDELNVKFLIGGNDLHLWGDDALSGGFNLGQHGFSLFLASPFAKGDRGGFIFLVIDRHVLWHYRVHTGGTKMRATIAIDDALFNEAFLLSNVKTKKDLINLSLQEYIRKKRLEDLAGMYSSNAVSMTCEELEEYRSDEK
jgi:Arc/MetJ family transcription regulator